MLGTVFSGSYLSNMRDKVDIVTKSSNLLMKFFCDWIEFFRVNPPVLEYSV